MWPAASLPSHGDAEKRPQRRMGLLRQWASGSKEGEFFYSHAYDMLMGVAADCGEVEVRDAIWRMLSVCCWRRGMYAPCILPARAAGSAAPTRGC